MANQAVSHEQLKKYDQYIKAYINNGGKDNAALYLDLSLYADVDKSFIYDSTLAYKYNDSYTTLQEYVENEGDDDEVHYAIFKVNDIDIYLVYTINTATKEYTYSTQYTSASIPAKFKSLFEIGSYSTLFRLTQNGSSFNPSSVTDFINSSNKKLRSAYITGITYGSVLESGKSYLLATSGAVAFVYVYNSSTGYYDYQAYYNSSSQNMVNAISAIIDCAVPKYDAGVDYPDGSIGKMLSTNITMTATLANGEVHTYTLVGTDTTSAS